MPQLVSQRSYTHTHTHTGCPYVARRFTLCSGALLVHVSSADDLLFALAQLRETAPARSLRGPLAEASAVILASAVRAFPQNKIRSLHDVVCLSRGRLAPTMLKMLSRLNEAHAMFHHMADEFVQAVAGEIARAVGALGAEKELHRGVEFYIGDDEEDDEQRGARDSA